MAIKINTAAVDAAAKNIQNINTTINTDFAEMERSIKSLNSYWDGSASNNALNKFNSIKNAFYSDRYTVIKNLVNFLDKQVADGYERTENVIQSTASRFK